MLIRYHRMRGYNALWLPGTDHAGIATQVVVERQLKAEGLTRHDLGREKFVERVWEWQARGGRPHPRSRSARMGASADWSRTKFTMDPDLCVAVREAFVRLYEEGLIYRATRLVNWDIVVADRAQRPRGRDRGGRGGRAVRVRLSDRGAAARSWWPPRGPRRCSATRRIAVHPDDPRYTHLHGKFVKHPFVDRKIPIITDAELVDMSFGTGAVKVTPAHDFNDFATGKRHELEEINIFTLDGKMNENGGEFAGSTASSRARP